MCAVKVCVLSCRVDTSHLTGQLPDLVRDVELPGGYNLDDYSTTQVRKGCVILVALWDPRS